MIPQLLRDANQHQRHQWAQRHSKAALPVPGGVRRIPIARGLLRVGLPPDVVTILGTTVGGGSMTLIWAEAVRELRVWCGSYKR